MRFHRLAAWLAGGLLAVGLALLVWPTAYRDLPIRSPGARYLAARQHRVTGRVELLTREGWLEAAPAPVIAPEDTALVRRARELAEPAP